ncbi:MAG TPA: peptidylprolyl isomerase [Lachnospiraceae bacterium]|nr:peptidylprolyl isomerase [Lachnospiraceae bacterium]
MTQNPIVTITMTNGDIMKAELFPDVAPISVNNFIHLVEKKYYDGLIFHRVIKGFMIQGGCPDGTGMGGPGYSIKGEFSQNGIANNLDHSEGVLSMARSMSPNSAGSQFFLMHKDSPHLNGAYAAFGKVMEGMDIVNKIAETKTDYSDKPLEDQKIKSMVVETFGISYPEPEKL